MSHAPGFDRDTRSEPCEGTKGVIMEAAATGEPDRSWIVTIHPFLSLPGLSLSPETVLIIHPLLFMLLVKSDGRDLFFTYTYQKGNLVFIVIK